MSQRESEHGHPFDRRRVESALSSQPSPDEVERLAELMSLVGDPIRTRIIYALLAVDELCVGDLAIAAQTSDSAASYALRVLRTAGLVQRRREGRMNFYRLTDDETQPALRAALTQLRRVAAG